MKRLYTIFAFIVLALSAFAQMSMPQLYKQWTIEDINKGNYQKALTEFQQSDFSFYADDADMQLDLNKYDAFVQYAFNNNISDEQKISLYKYTADFAYSYADYFFNEKQLVEAKQMFEVAVQYYSPIQEFYPLETTLANNMLGNVLNQLNMYSLAADSYFNALDIVQTSITDTFNLKHTIINNMIDNYLLLGDTINAEKYFLTNNPITQPIDTADIYTFMWKLLAEYHYFKSEYQQSLPYFKHTIELYHIANNAHEEVNALWNTSYNCLVLQDTTQALQYLNQAYQLAITSSITDYPLQFTLSTLAKTYYKLENYDKSLQYSSELYDISSKNPQEGANFSQEALDGKMLNDLELGNFDSLKEDIRLGANVNTKQWDVNPLHRAILQDNSKYAGRGIEVNRNPFTQLLLTSGALIDDSPTSYSYLETAVLFEDYRLCYLLMQYGASPKHLIYDETMNIIQYAESCGLKRFVELFRKPKSYSETLTIQELDELYKRAHNQNDFATTEKLCEQALGQFYEEIDETKYDGFRTRQQILFYYVSAMVNNVIELETEYVATRDESILKAAEEKLLQAIELNTERKKYPDNYNLGFGDLDEKLLGLINDRNGLFGDYNGVQINALNQLKFRKELGLYDKYYYYTLAQAAHYLKEQSLKEPARELYRELLEYIASTNNAVDSIGSTNYMYLIQDMAYLQETPEDTLILRKEFEHTKMFIKNQCGNDSSCYYSYMCTLGWHIIPYMEMKQNIEKYIKHFDNNNTYATEYYDMQFMPLLMYSTEIEPHDTVLKTEYLQEAEKLLPILPYTQASVQHTFSEYWIWMNFDLVHRFMLDNFGIDNPVNYTTADTTYSQKVWEVVPIFFRTNKNKIQDRLSTMSSEMATAWLNNTNPYFTDQYIYLSTNNSEPPSESVAAIYDNELFKKGLLLRNSNNLLRYLTESTDTTALYIYNKIQTLKAEREQYRTQPFSDSIVTGLTQEIDNKERTLYNLSGKYKEQMQYDNISWQDIRANLKEGEVAVEFVNYGYIDQYFALILKHNYDYPILVKLPDFKNQPKAEKDRAWEWYEKDLDICIANYYCPLNAHNRSQLFD